MHQLPYEMPGRFYRGNLHTHSTNSDGKYSPEEVVRRYQENGYDFVAITDHFMERFGYSITDTSQLRSREFTTLIGSELHTSALANGEVWHLVTAGIPLDFTPPSEGETGPELASRAAAAGAFVGIAHPAWYGMTVDEARSVEAAHAVEVYNETCVMLNDRGDSWYVLDTLLAEGRRLTGYGADDAHFSDGRPDAFAAWVCVRAEALEPEPLLEALKAGHYYTSQGPSIHAIEIDGNDVVIRCSPARGIYVSGPAWTFQHAHGFGVSEARFSLEPFLHRRIINGRLEMEPAEAANGSDPSQSRYCRVTVVDGHGRKAWSNPIWLD
jgi:hypothetical protein